MPSRLMEKPGEGIFVTKSVAGYCGFRMRYFRQSENARAGAIVFSGNNMQEAKNRGLSDGENPQFVSCGTKPTGTR